MGHPGAVKDLRWVFDAKIESNSGVSNMDKTRQMLVSSCTGGTLYVWNVKKAERVYEHTWKYSEILRDIL